MSAIRYEVDGGIATITIDRPEKRNAMTFAVLAEFTSTVLRAADDPEARAVILAGAGGAFCAGTDLSDLSATPEGDRFGPGADDPRAKEPWVIVACPKPVIAAVDGAAYGMGVEIATQCDVRLASTTAKFGWVFVHRGLVPDMGAGTFLLPRLVGATAALRVLLSGEPIDAAEAERIGFVSRVVEPDQLLDAARAEAERYLSGSPFAIARTKRLLYESMGGEVAEHLRRHRAALAECFTSDDHEEGVASFLERRPARFTGT
jgi:enoyl-CoA hydratase/carnithine racemase